MTLELTSMRLQFAPEEQNMNPTAPNTITTTTTTTVQNEEPKRTPAQINYAPIPSMEPTVDLRIRGFQYIARPLPNCSEILCVNLGFQNQTKLKDSCTDCCLPGSCCYIRARHIMPFNSITRDDGLVTQTRMNLAYDVTAPLGVIQNPPAFLFRANGLTAEAFVHQMTLLGQLRKRYSGLASECNSLLKILLLPCLCCYWMHQRRDEVVRWSDALLQWQVNWNRELEPLGLFVKTQSVCVIKDDGIGKRTRFVRLSDKADMMRSCYVVILKVIAH